MSVVDKIPDMDSEKRLKLFKNALRLIREGRNEDEAKRVIDALQSIWSDEVGQFKAGTFKAPSPRNGMLSAVGYHVGESKGVSEAERHGLLDFIMSGTLPPIGTPAYYAEWGEPLSRQRYRKLHRVLQVFASGAKHRQDPAESNMIKAAREWNEDLRYIERRWKDAVR